MKLIIDIPEEDYKNGTLINCFKVYSTELDKIIYDGTPLESQPTPDDEIIKALKAVRTIHNGNYALQIDEAIRRLEAQPTDAVSREAVIRLVEQYPNIIGNRCSGLISDIKHLPSVTPRTNLAKTSQDCISRQAVDTLVDELARAISDERCFMSRGRATSTIMQDILDLPSVTPKIEPCEDAVSREAVLNTEYQIKNINDIEYVMLSEVQMKMRKLPPVTPQRPKGKWMNKQFINSIDGDIRDGWECSKCQSRFFRYDIPNTEDFILKYCPNCGAEMSGGGEDGS